jgi:hypothetical protein
LIIAKDRSLDRFHGVLEAATRPQPSPSRGGRRHGLAVSGRRGATSARGPQNPDMESIVPKEIGTTEVRQGRTPHIVRYVLAISLTAAVVALAVVWIVMMN